MSALIEKLKSDHKAVLKLVATLEIHLKAVELGRVNETLTTLKTALLAHLTQEDAELYPALVRMAGEAKEEDLARTARAFEGNMQRITEGLVAFLKKYEGKSYDIVAFNSDWKSIVDILGARITAEENVLYPMYEKALKQQQRK